jgi:hypothetical protein
LPGKIVVTVSQLLVVLSSPHFRQFSLVASSSGSFSLCGSDGSAVAVAAKRRLEEAKEEMLIPCPS